MKCRRCKNEAQAARVHCERCLVSRRAYFKELRGSRSATQEAKALAWLNSPKTARQLFTLIGATSIGAVLKTLRRLEGKQLVVREQKSGICWWRINESSEEETTRESDSSLRER